MSGPILCDNCGEREAEGIDEHGSGACSECEISWRLSEIVCEEITAQAIGALSRVVDRGRELGLTPEQLTWALEDGIGRVIG